MNKYITKNANWLIISIALIVVNILQAQFTELANDEAYYWMYAQRLDWGYFDHPPMIALLIYLGDLIGHGELYLRLFTIILGGISFAGLWILCGKRDLKLFSWLFFATTAFQVYGLIAVPDAPLIASSIWFFVFYKQYLHHDSIKNSALLVTAIACMLYSKYHAILILAFTILSNPGLFSRRSFYLIFLCSTLLYLPHLYWQIENGYPSWQFHVLNKSQSAYNPEHTLVFPFETILLAGPITGILLIYGLIKSESQSTIERSYKFCFWGFFVFFLLSTINAPIEANWMAASVIPLFAGAYNFIASHSRIKEIALKGAMLTCCVFGFIRVNLATDLVPALGSKAIPEFFGWKSWAQDVKKEVNQLPLAIVNSYQKASKYAFYNQEDCLSLNNPSYRKNQFDLWDISDAFQGKTVAVLLNYDYGYPSRLIQTNHGDFYLLIVDQFRSYQHVEIHPSEKWIKAKANEEINLALTMSTKRPQLYFDQNPKLPVSVVCQLYYYEQALKELHVKTIETEKLSNPTTINWTFNAPEKPGPYYLKWGIRVGFLPSTINSPMIRMDVD